MIRQVQGSFSNASGVGRRLAIVSLVFLLPWVVHAAAADGHASCGIETRSTPIGGGTVAYDIVGSGPPVLLVHGLFANKEQWSALACRLAGAGYSAIAVD